MKGINETSALATATILAMFLSSCSQQKVNGVLTTELFRDENVRLAKLEIDPHATVPPHIHPGVEEGYVAEGALMMQSGDGTCTPFKQYETFRVPAGTRMTVTNNTDKVTVLYSLIAGLHGKPHIQPVPGPTC